MDIAYGNGQASYLRLEHLEQVLTCNRSIEQLQASRTRSHVQLFATHAQAEPLTNQSINLMVIAQALHGFATPVFFKNMHRLLKPGVIDCA
ncbi:methyltransferase domain-containing protein [Pseudomonas sp. SL4(2022)]|uniref:methyltransferase domain-containing protein n=1 Tax=Pseudomonas sp. SL4(2022) TaxID=2994661 RepID=UPI002271E70B|nr:methyltransferase domain-containing protein [Pseudomonas sp. SL4(2022)]WAC45074.1 methyltransferase domain-containing protein [Pseudomonas sp. SL4(2022)]